VRGLNEEQIRQMVDINGLFSADGCEITRRMSKFFPKGSTLGAIVDGFLREGLLPSAERLRIWCIRDHKFVAFLTDFTEVVTAEQIRFDVMSEPDLQGSDLLAAVAHAQNDGILRWMYDPFLIVLKMNEKVSELFDRIRGLVKDEAKVRGCRIVSPHTYAVGTETVAVALQRTQISSMPAVYLARVPRSKGQEPSHARNQGSIKIYN
jgi:hypothetical protein